MRVVFIGRRTGFNNGAARWLSERYDLRAVFYIEEGWNRRANRVRAVQKRAKRIGLRRIADELLFYGYYLRRYGRGDERLWRERLPAAFQNPPPADAPTHSCADIHSPRWLDEIAACEPDILFSVCAKTIFQPALFNLPKMGMFILHEGITPEYRGLHTAGWALLQGEPQYVGYSLLKAEKGIDTGPILCQGAYPDAANWGFHWRFIGHQALAHGLPAMEAALDGLYANGGRFEPVSQEGRVSRNYSWIGMSDYLRCRRNPSTRALFRRWRAQ
ncbi:MAG: formyltransferase family protein [Candidatus Poribacteria bacterium]|nr:formyltransferase family protein [Candidatus Poribacteria bacterium]